MSYTNPTGTAINTTTTTGGTTGGAGAGAVGSTAEDRARFVEYTCGDCDASVSLKRGEPIRCRQCGHRVLYKQRTSRMVQFEAR
ncbi:uncharacterized protein EI97DRAFT_435108 [Westerdykella ornata]|uniref:Metallothionein-I gene transcription activator n=1 Tax=Westerdykella ornata TaxID=318751 RepID=A0A6A6JD68_WESOR|nr:uncharacterized protein EI97DRAFT_435108 [Westerdykella ornata]KAF2274570.1 hypothetical protein EI97DRAFT_435108 [Westerdykella ornata]